jgi:WD40 repeat protein
MDPAWYFGRIKMKDEETIQLKTFGTRAHEKDVDIVHVTPNDLLNATGSQDKTLKLWKGTDLSLVATRKDHKTGRLGLPMSSNRSFSSYNKW